MVHGPILLTHQLLTTHLVMLLAQPSYRLEWAWQ